MENSPSRALRKKEYEDRMKEYEDRKKELDFDDYKSVSRCFSYEPSISYVLLSQAMRQNKEIDLLGSDYQVVRPWHYPVSTNLKVSQGRMYNSDGEDCTHHFWNEIYWLYVYFNQEYGFSDFDRYYIGDFITFGYNDNTYSENNTYESTRPYDYIGEFCSCPFISEWVVRNIKNMMEHVDEIRWADLRYVGTILPGMVWDRHKYGYGPIDILFGSKYFSLIPIFVERLIDKYGKKKSENMIRETLNHIRSGSKPHSSFWKEQLRNYSLTDEYNVQVTRPQLLDLLKCFKEYGLNILRKGDVESQCLASPIYIDNVGFKDFEAAIMLVGRFGFDIMAYRGESVRSKGWGYETRPPLISNVKNIYELVRANVPSLLTDRNQIPNQISRKRKHNEE
jgi:hypothetical protein